MADTLAEIHNSTLQESDFNSSGEATLLTTNSSTKHVIKNVQITEGDSTLPVGGTLNIAGMDVVALTGNSSGAEIVGPSSAIKVKTSTFPLQYVDEAFVNKTSSSQYSAVSFPLVNGLSGFTPNVASSGNAIGHSQFSGNATRNTLYLNLGPNNYTMMTRQNHPSSISTLELRQSDGTLVTNYTDAYMPWWFDDTQFAYRYDKNNNRIDKLDCFTGTLSTLKSVTGLDALGTYAQMFGVNDHNGNTKHLFFWTRYNTKYFVYNFDDDTSYSFTGSSDGNNVYSYTSTAFWYAIMKTDGSIVLITPRQTSRFQYWDWVKGTTYSSSISGTDVSLSSGARIFQGITFNMQVVKNRIYYVSYNNSNMLDYYDADIAATDTAYKSTGLTFSGIGSYEYGVNLTKITPSNSTISGRTYTHTPSLKLRITGVTST